MAKGSILAFAPFTMTRSNAAQACADPPASDGEAEVIALASEYGRLAEEECRFEEEADDEAQIAEWAKGRRSLDRVADNLAEAMERHGYQGALADGRLVMRSDLHLTSESARFCTLHGFGSATIAGLRGGASW